MNEQREALAAAVERLAEDCERRASYCPCVGQFNQTGIEQGPYCGNGKHAENVRWSAILRAALTHAAPQDPA